MAQEAKQLEVNLEDLLVRAVSHLVSSFAEVAATRDSKVLETEAHFYRVLEVNCKHKAGMAAAFAKGRTASSASNVKWAKGQMLGWQLVTGLRLLWAKVARAGDVYSSIQTATAVYLLVYIPSHLIAVFILGRWFLGVDTTFAWASGAPSGLLLDVWNVRLIPHYSLAVLFVIGHLAVGLRAVLLGHGVGVAVADRAAWIICSTGLALAIIIAIAQLSVGG
jgi:hypothetical protein